MVTNRVFEHTDDTELRKARLDAQYWQNSYLDEVRLSRTERYAAVSVGFFCGAMLMGLVALLSLWR